MKPFNPHKLDVQRFCQLAGQLSGEAPVERMPRLGSSVHWQAQGALHGAMRQLHPLIHLQAQATVGLTCQRCLQALPLELQVQRRFLFAPNETLAARWDAEQDELDDIDVLAISSSLDLPNLAEEELLLHLPYAPVHTHCPTPLPAAESAVPSHHDDATGEPCQPHPFAKLAVLKKT